MKSIYFYLILFYFVTSFELLSMQHQVKTSSSLGDLETTSDEVVIKSRSKSLKNLRKFQTLNLDLEYIKPNFAKYGNNAIKRIPAATPVEITKFIIGAHQQLVNDLQNLDLEENHIQNGLPNSNTLINSDILQNSESTEFNLAKYQIGKMLIKSETNKNKNGNKNISPATSKRIKSLTTGSIDPQKVWAAKIKNGNNAKNGENCKNGINGENEKNEKNEKNGEKN